MSGGGESRPRGRREPDELESSSRREDGWRERHAEDVRAELEDHVERRARRLMAAGMSPEEARAEALRRLGEIDRIEGALMRIAEHGRRRARLSRLVEDARQDVRLALRGFVRRPVQSAGVLLTVALAMGAAASVFSVVNGVLLRPLPYPSSDRLHAVWTRYLPSTGYDFPYFPLSGPELADYRAELRAMSGVAGYQGMASNLAAPGAPPERVFTVAATADLFDVLGVPAALGRSFAAGDDAPGAECVAVLSEGLWRERFGGEVAAVGSEIRIDGRPCSVIGVMPRGFAFPDERFRLWTTLPFAPTPDERQSHNLLAVARLSAGATTAEAQQELERLHASWSAEFPDHYAAGHFLVLRSFREQLVGDARPALLVLFGAVGVVLLIVCVNLAGLMLTGAEARRREFAVRAALGGRRRRLTRQVLAEALVLSVAGGLLGLLLATPMLRAILALYPGQLPRASTIRPDGAVLLFTLGVAVLAGVAFGLLPALASARVRSAEVLTASRGVAGLRSGARARRVFVVAETALALLLAFAAALLAQSYGRLRAVDLGFDAGRAVAFALSVPPASYPEARQAREVFVRIEERLEVIPGVTAVGAISDLPLRTAGGADDFRIEGQAPPGPGQPALNARYVMATPGVAAALGLRVLRGRWLEPNDRPGVTPVAVVNEALVRTYFDGGDAIGERILYPWNDSVRITIVGVVADVRSLGAATEAPPSIYVAHAQAPRAAYAGRFMNVLVRSDRDHASVAATVRRAVGEVDAALPVSDLTTLQRVADEATGQPRFTMTMMSGFAAMALLLGALGVYGVVAQGAQQRTREIGIRLALGAGREEVLRLIMGQGLRMVAAGILIGAIVAVLLRRVLADLVFEVGTLDPLSLAVAAAILLGVALVACFIPAHRATRADPASALRAE